MNKDAQKILVEMVKKSAGQLKPRAVVDAARDEDSPLHSYFDWNDETAGEKYRLWQARQLICNVRIVIDEKAAQPKTVRAFVNLLPERAAGGGYRLLADVVSNEQHRNDLLKTAIIELSAWKKRHAELVELCGPVWGAAMEVAENLGIESPLFQAA